MADFFERKSIAAVRAETAGSKLRTTLSGVNLVLIGIGCIVGAGIYVMTGTAAAQFAGPAVIVSFLIAAAACGCAALCYAELAAMLPGAGASYTYAYVVFGRGIAWMVAWLLLLEYGVAAATVAVGWSGYATSMLSELGVSVPSQAASATIQQGAANGVSAFAIAPSANLWAGGAVLTATAVVSAGIRESALVNNIMVAVKVGVLLIFVAVGAQHVNAENWSPFVPEYQGGFTFGWQGVIRAAAVVFFAFIGFEAVAIASAEARNPTRDVPVGIIGALTLCTVLYVCVGVVLTGVVSYTQLGRADPLAVAVRAMNEPVLGTLVISGALAGLSSVLLVLIYGQSRVFLAVAGDGLLPRVFARVDATKMTPAEGTWVLGGAIALTATLLPITILGDLVSLGTALAFVIVCSATMRLRVLAPDEHRPFRVPFGGIMTKHFWLGWAPLCGVLLGVGMAAPIIADLVMRALNDDVIPLLILASYVAAGALVYMLYGGRSNRQLGGAHG